MVAARVSQMALPNRAVDPVLIPKFGSLIRLRIVVKRTKLMIMTTRDTTNAKAATRDPRIAPTFLGIREKTNAIKARTTVSLNKR